MESNEKCAAGFEKCDEAVVKQLAQDYAQITR